MGHGEFAKDAGRDDEENLTLDSVGHDKIHRAPAQFDVPRDAPSLLSPRKWKKTVSVQLTISQGRRRRKDERGREQGDCRDLPGLHALDELPKTLEHDILKAVRCELRWEHLSPDQAHCIAVALERLDQLE
ncbi:hypothetical protein FVE85_4692 [Porphyridium purpureum]|uniref:Uncharacterized protein n=1 Tax=Porphyridium purpureum TaxID=35688 RepID=A0A5J4YQP1_PORPP|nr:hypothetical protein FVE85_4692 [Porphyridium purpureum]|eukprot:POR1807..scf236_6